MRLFIVGIILGMCVDHTVTAMAKDALGRSPQQQQYNYFRDRQQQFDIEHMRRQIDQQDLDRRLGRKPC